MSGTKCNTWFDTRLRTLFMVAAAAVAVVVFIWRSQAAQDVNINANDRALAVVTEKLDGIKEGLGEVKAALVSLDAHVRSGGGMGDHPAPVAVTVNAKE